jgi:hypothetical protein
MTPKQFEETANTPGPTTPSAPDKQNETAAPRAVRVVNERIAAVASVLGVAQ